MLPEYLCFLVLSKDRPGKDRHVYILLIQHTHTHTHTIKINITNERHTDIMDLQTCNPRKDTIIYANTHPYTQILSKSLVHIDTSYLIPSTQGSFLSYSIFISSFSCSETMSSQNITFTCLFSLRIHIKQVQNCFINIIRIKKKTTKSLPDFSPTSNSHPAVKDWRSMVKQCVAT